VLSHELKHPLNLINVKAEMLPRLPEARGVTAIVEAADAINLSARPKRYRSGRAGRQHGECHAACSEGTTGWQPIQSP